MVQKFAEFDTMDWYTFILEYCDTMVDSGTSTEGDDDDYQTETDDETEDDEVTFL